MNLFKEAKGISTTYEPYKYVMNDMGSIYLGAKFSYQELLDNPDLNFKLRSVISHYVLKYSDKENTLESEFYYLNKDNGLYDVFNELKVKVKVLENKEKKNLFGKTSTVNTERVLQLKELTEIDTDTKKGEGMVICEVIISKLALMSFTI